VQQERSFAVVGLGYVGLPVAVALGRQFNSVFGFDTSSERIAELRAGIDRTGEIEAAQFAESSVCFTSDITSLATASFYIVCVPTPVDMSRHPDLRALEQACKAIGRVMKSGALVVLESTVYPGLTREFCRPLLAQSSGLVPGKDFKVGYSPERINPGDKVHRLENLVKVVSGEDDETLERVAKVYGAIVAAGVYRAPSLEVAEAAKVIENTQRDLNIALMNELAMIFERLRIPTVEVLRAAATKWNFLQFSPGLVGGHCIGVDPYYLTYRAEAAGYYPEVVLAGRRINDSMGGFIGQRLAKMIAANGHTLSEARVGILGLTFKENVRDIRNSRVPDIVRELRSWGIEVLVHDPMADAQEAVSHYGIELLPESMFRRLDGLVVAVPHEALTARLPASLDEYLSPGGSIVDVKSILDPRALSSNYSYWAL
jgi:UDP-N-acetyl-D-galactosamine dehydrogenase